MISKHIKTRKDGKSSASDALRYGEGLKVDRETGELLNKSHRTRIGNFGLVDDGIYTGRDIAEMSELIDLAAIEMQANCDLNTRISADKKLAHFVVSYNQDKPTEAVLRDTEDSMLAVMKLDKNHFATFLHNDNGHWHLHIFASRIEKEKPHRGNSLWHDQINRDRVCREIEIRHDLPHDNGLHQISELGQIVEIPRAERQAKRDAKPVGISDRAKTTEIYSGEKSFQTWANEIRIGDRLKHAKSWKDLHAAAAAYGCEVKEKSGGFVLCPAGQKGGISLSKIGLKKLPEKYGIFQKSEPDPQESSEIPPLAESKEKTYKPGPLLENGKTHYARWKESKVAFQIVKNDRGNAQREDHALTRQRLRVQHKSELAQIRATTPRPDQFAAISIAKMNHTVALAALNDIFAKERKSLRDELVKTAPGNTFRDFLVIQAAKGDDIALGLARRYGWEEATDVLRQREADQLKIVAAVQGQEDRPAPRLQITHQVERNGTVIYDFGNGRKVIDSAISKQVQLNAAAAHSPQAIATALRFATTKFGNTLSLTGTIEFQRLAVETAVSQRLGIKFADPELEAYRAQLDAQQRTAARLGASETRSKSRNRPDEIGTTGSSIVPTGTGAKHIHPIQTTRESPLTTAERFELDRAKKKAQREAPHEAEKSVVVALDAGHQSLHSGPAPELDFLADIHQQIDLAKAAAAPGSSLANSTTTEADHEVSGSGVILAANVGFVAVLDRHKVQIYKVSELVKNLTYDGLDTTGGCFAKGNELIRKRGADGMRTVVTEKRLHMQSPENCKDNRGVGR